MQNSTYFRDDMVKYGFEVVVIAVADFMVNLPALGGFAGNNETTLGIEIGLVDFLN